MTLEQRTHRIPVDFDGADPLVRAYLEQHRQTCAGRVLSWWWIPIGFIAAVAGGIIANRLGGAPAALTGGGDHPVQVMHHLLGDPWASIGGFCAGGLVAALVGSVLRPSRIPAAQEPLIGTTLALVIYLLFYDLLAWFGVAIGLVTLVYAAAIVFRILALICGRRPPHTGTVPQEPAGGWPIYTVLVPLYREPEVAASILASLERLDYPRDRLDVKLLLEADDPETRPALDKAGLPEWIEVVIVPQAQPKTKPRACNHGLARARGEFLVIFDAEDRPDPDQLKLAVASFHSNGHAERLARPWLSVAGWILFLAGLGLMAAAGHEFTRMVGTQAVGSIAAEAMHTVQEHGQRLFAFIGVAAALLVVGGLTIARGRPRRGVVCLQAQLAYHNHDQNLLTRWFAIEYNVWFRRYLGGLSRVGVPIPLGGTSNHFRTDALRELGGWDPFNVTEDCDLGVRLHVAGYRTRMLDSVTWEEANSQVGNWVRQRSRWLKGYLVTHLVWWRRPLWLLLRLGPWGACGFTLSVFCVAALSALNLLLWCSSSYCATLLACDMARGYPLWELISSRHPVSSDPSAGDPWSLPMLFLGRHEDPVLGTLSAVFFVAAIALLLGNLVFIAVAAIFGRRPAQRGLLLPALISPFYWVLISIAAWKAVYELVVKPHYWQKTVHGLGKK